ncbi:MAG: tyrosine-type recombinase/integrase [Lachnospiraceae bacterium]|nr:tyrosine-type recombinase/integrase [Lachnospiraceae bacterium]
MNSEKTLDEFISTILNEMGKEQFRAETCRQYMDVYKRLQRLAVNRKEQFYSKALGQAFLEDCNYVWKKGVHSHHRFFFHKRCILLLEKLIATGKIDWSKCLRSDAQLRSFNVLFFAGIYTEYIQVLQDEGMKPSTICSYSRASYYFLKHLEEKGYQLLDDICPGDATDSFLEMCKTHWDSKCLGSYISGLKKLLNMSDVSRVFIRELPSHMLRKREIIEVYSDEEHAQIFSYLEHAEILKRNKAISLLAIETGMRAIDICNIKLTDVDWKNESIHLIQEKTGHALDLPLRASYGNSMMDYLLEERPDSDSEFFFLQCRALYGKIVSHNCIFHILKVIK